MRFRTVGIDWKQSRLRKRNQSNRRGLSSRKGPRPLWHLDALLAKVADPFESEGLPIAYEVFDGIRADVTTVEEIVKLMEEKYGQAQRVWVLDCGMVSENNLD